MKDKQRHSLFLGILYIVSAMLCFALMGVFVKLMGSKGTPTLALFARSFVNLLLFLPLCFKYSLLLTKLQAPIKLLFRNLFGLMAIWTAFFAIQYLPLANAILLNNTAPLFLPLVILILTRTKTPFMVLVGVFIGFIGVVFILRPTIEGVSFPSIVGLASGLFGAIALFLIRDISKTTPGWKIVFYYSLTGTLVTGLIMLFQWQQITWSHTLFLFLSGIGIFGALYQVFLTQALSYAPARIITPLVFLGIFFAALLDWLIWDDVPSLLTLIGFVVMISGGVIAIFFGKKHIIGKKS